MGVGKLLLILVLFWIFEKVGGSIIIDDVDILIIGLYDFCFKLIIIF